MNETLGDDDLIPLLLADARLPVGGHTQSAGLEPALLAGMPEHRIEAFIAARLRTVVLVEAGTAVVARHASLADACLDAVTQAWEARTPSEAVRAASYEAGRGWSRLLSRQTSAPPLGRRTPRPVAVGAVAARLGLSAEGTARLVCYEDIAALTSAALKLSPLDPLDTVDWTLDNREAAATVVTEVSGLTAPDDIPAAAAPLLETWQHRHPTYEKRLFHA